MSFATKKEALLVFLLLACTYVYFYHDPGWNGNSRLGLTFAIVEEGRLTIDSFHNQVGTFTKDKAIYEGHYYTSKAIGSSLVAALFYYPLFRLENLLGFKLAIGELKYLLTFFSIGLPSALAGGLMYVLCKQVTGKKLHSFVFTVAVNLGTMMYPFSVIFFAHQLAGSLLFIAFFLIFQMKLGADSLQKRDSFLVGFLLGFALITEYPVAPIVLILTIYYFVVIFTKVVENRGMAAVLPALGALIPIAVVVAYNVVVFENLISTGYTHSADGWFLENQTQGLVGIGWPDPKVMYYMSLHPAFGLFWQSPLLILSLIGMWFMWRAPGYKFETLIAATAFFSLLILYSGFYNWYGGWTFGPRYLIPMLPFMCLPLAFLPRRWFPSVVILGLISITGMFIAATTSIIIPDTSYKLIDTLGYFQYSSIYSYCLQLLLDGEFATNIGTKLLGLNAWVSLIPVLLVLLGITIAFFAMHDDATSLPLLKSQASI
jgi:hypothetical protein